MKAEKVVGGNVFSRGQIGWVRTTIVRINKGLCGNTTN